MRCVDERLRTEMSTLDNTERAGEIVLAVPVVMGGAMDGEHHSTAGRRGQKWHPVRYESGVRLVVEMDAKMLLHQLNFPALDLVRAMITRWITWIKPFGPGTRHTPAQKHSGEEGGRL